MVREEDLAVLSSSLPAGKMNDDNCSQASHLDKPIILDFKEIKATTDNQRLNDVKGFTELKHEQWILSPAGSEHYILLHHLATQPSIISTCPRHHQHLVDIGTRYVTSALAMASASPMHPKVLTFDTPTSIERTRAFRGKTEEE